MKECLLSPQATWSHDTKEGVDPKAFQYSEYKTVYSSKKKLMTIHEYI